MIHRTKCASKRCWLYDRDRSATMCQSCIERGADLKAEDVEEMLRELFPRHQPDCDLDKSLFGWVYELELATRLVEGDFPSEEDDQLIIRWVECRLLEKDDARALFGAWPKERQ
jgi:hypothetical protein